MRWAVDRLTGLVLLTLGVLLGAFEAGPVETLRNLMFDSYLQAAPREYQPAPVRIVEIDDESLRRLGQWPWPRWRLAELVDRLGGMGAAAIGVNLLLAEPDRTGPDQLAEMWGQLGLLEEAAAALEVIPDPDRILALTLSSGPTIVGFSPLTDGGRQPEPRAGIAFSGTDPRLLVDRFPGAATSLPIFEQAAQGNGSLHIAASGGGDRVREMPLLVAIGDQVYPSFTLEALRVVQGASTILARATDGSGETMIGGVPDLAALRVGAFDIPVSSGGAVLLYPTGPEPGRSIPAWRVLEGDVLDPVITQEIAGRIVLVGASAAGLSSLWATSAAEFETAVSIQAQLLEQIILGDYLSRPNWVAGGEVLLTIVLGLLLIILAPRVGPVRTATIGFLFVVTIATISWVAFREFALLVDPVFPSLATGAPFLVLSMLTFIRSDREKARVRQAFGRYLSPTLVERLAKQPEQLTLGGEVRTVTVMFTDIRGFTSLAETMDAQTLTRFLNRYLTPMTDAVLANAGTIDKYMGDAIMAFWNAPLDVPEHPACAAATALEMLNRLDRFNAELAAEAAATGETHRPVGMGIGVNTGEALVGNLGSLQRFDYSVIGDTANLASRLEGQCRVYGVPIILGPDTIEALDGWALTEIDRIRVKGKARPARIAALWGDSERGATPAFQSFAALQTRFLSLYRAQDWDGAEAALDSTAEAALAADVPYEGLAAAYRQRLEDFRLASPGPDWDGVHTSEIK